MYEISYTLYLCLRNSTKNFTFNVRIFVQKGEYMLNNLEKLRKERGVTLVDMADLLHVRYQTVSDKISGISDFKFQEAVLIQQNFFPEFDLVYLFSKDSEIKQPA